MSFFSGRIKNRRGQPPTPQFGIWEGRYPLAVIEACEGYLEACSRFTASDPKQIPRQVRILAYADLPEWSWQAKRFVHYLETLPDMTKSPGHLLRGGWWNCRAEPKDGSTEILLVASYINQSAFTSDGDMSFAST